MSAKRRLAVSVGDLTRRGRALREIARPRVLFVMADLPLIARDSVDVRH